MNSPPRAIDLRSDTVTRPSPGMWAALQATDPHNLGDDVYGEDPAVTALEEAVAAYFGFEAGLFCASGTMTNQIAIQLHVQAPAEVLCAPESHVYLYEGGGMAYHARAQVKLVPSHRGLLTAQAVAQALQPDNDVHKPATQLVCLENTANRGGGACYHLAEVARIRHACQQAGVPLHLDGARVWNALVARNEDPLHYGQLFHSASVCFSKGLGAPVGSALLGTADFIRRGRRLRKLMGGGWRQAGLLATAAHHALRHQVARLATDHQHAQLLGQALQAQPWVAHLHPVETNIVLFQLTPPHTSAALVAHLRAHGVLAGAVTDQWVRMVTHLDISEDDVLRVVNCIVHISL